jgi:hypothetical protein
VICKIKSSSWHLRKGNSEVRMGVEYKPCGLDYKRLWCHWKILNANKDSDSNELIKREGDSEARMGVAFERANSEDWIIKRCGVGGRFSMQAKIRIPMGL